jgi:lysophospholipase L1-like esterase
MKPWYTLLFLGVVLGALALIGAVMPESGVKLGALELDFPDPRTLLHPAQEEKVDISDIIALEVDSLTEEAVDTLVVDTPKVPIKVMIAYPNDDPGMLRPALAALNNASKGARPVRVLHYGDSQLEGDRITSYLRNKFQLRWGGGGTGLVPILDVGPSFSVDREPSENWKRYSVMERQKPALGHERFGALWSFCRYTPATVDSLIVDSVVSEGSILFRKVKRAYGRSQQYSRCHVFFGHNRRPLTLELSVDGGIPESREYEASNALRIADFNLGTPSSVKLTFKGADSPEVYGVSFESANGVAVDNIAARGAGGTELRKIDKGLLSAMYGALDVKLLILQYGGNAIPYIGSADDAEQYGSWVGSQITALKKLCPDAPVLFIGPSDMSVKEGTTWVTRPWVEETNAALKKHALANGAAFFDLYTAMGGRNSMVSWVEADPPLAAPDYTHFSPQGASKMAELFCTALFNDLQGLAKTDVKNVE